MRSPRRRTSRDHNFSLDYTLKSFEKVTLGVENETVRRMRRVLKESVYTLLGRMLWLCLGDDALLAEADKTRAEFATRFGGRSGRRARPSRKKARKRGPI